MFELSAMVRGKVQGVWFRSWTRETAREIGVTGWVRNLPDGGVETRARGSKAQLDLFEQRLWEGPPLARVTAVESSRTPAKAPFPSFEVRR